MTKFEIFNKIYGFNDDGFKAFFGERVSKRSLNEKFHDKEFVDEAINKLYVECPTKFAGESKNEKHYLLKPFWSVLDHYNSTVEICKDKTIGKSKLYWYWQLIIEILFTMSDYRWYMHPTATTRHGRFFLTPKINF